MKFFYITISLPSLLRAETVTQYIKLDRSLVTSTCDIGFCIDGTNCHDIRCSGCDFTCGGQCLINNKRTCRTWCKTDSCGEKTCAGCIFCNGNESKCPLATFQDVSISMFSQDPSYWYVPVHSGYPYLHHNTPTFVDIDDDGILDYFNSMHGHRIVNETGSLNNRMELALTKSSPNEDGKQVLESIAERIVFEDDPQDFISVDGLFIDAHGQNIVDLDGDGILDLYISQGGRYGLPTDNPAMFDNLLLFGEKNANGDVVFRGGRTQALKSGVNMRHGRGRISYILDVNGDGLLDMFVQQSRRVDNIIAPGVLLINQGNRTWIEDQSMMEYVNTMLLTDADGDGVTNEIMMIRGLCFPQRSGPGVDPQYPEFGEYTEDTLSFCRTRPGGTMAIYKFNKDTKSMEEISPKYHNIMANNDLQPSCCPHGSFDDNCAAISIVSGDFDNDKIADHALLFTDRLLFYFSSDRPKGTLPIGKDYQSLIIKLPDYCGRGESVRTVDLDNKGEINIVVMCQNPGAFVILDKGKSKKNWKVREDCSGSLSLGDLNDRSLAVPNMSELFDNVDCKSIQYKHYRKICREFQKNGKEQNKGATALTMVDMNNDGFTDAIVSHSFGYLRFHYNVPSDTNKNNKFIVFKLQGDGTLMNRYGIGATLILTSFNSDGKQYKQFREISSIQHTSDKKGYGDDRIIFGLGVDMTPSRLDVSWPNGRKQRIFLNKWFFEGSVKPILIEYPTVNDFFSIYLDHDDIDDTLCLSAGYGEEWKSIKVVPCSSPTPSHELFRFDGKQRLRSDRFPNYCVAPSTKPMNNNMEITLKHCPKVKSSWLRSSDGYLTISGSKKVITIGSANAGQIPFILDIDPTSKLQQWEIGAVGE